MKITGPELLKIAREGRPAAEYRLNEQHDCIAVKVGNEWHRVAGRLITGDDWFELGDLLINGQRVPFVPDMTL